MSLQVWLPLTKDLRNQGLSNVTVINNGATFDSAGKLGGCYTFDGNDYIHISMPSGMTTIKNTSVAAWVKSTSSTLALGGISHDTGNNIVGSCTLYSSGWQFSNNGSWGYISGGTIANTNTWHHVVCTISDDTITTYLNGVRVATDTVANKCAITTLNSSNFIEIGCDHPGGDEYLTGSVNDFRVYDHCLSPMEVKELSKGLVLHYPLNRGGFGQDNLMPNSIEMPVGSANPSTGTWRLAGSSQMTRSRVTISDAPSGASTYGFQSVGLQTGQDASCWGIDGFPRENGTTYTLSAWGRIVGGSSTAAMLGFSVYSGTTLDYGGTYGKAISSDAKYYGSGAYDYAGGQLNPNGNWTRIYRTFTSTSASDNIYIGFNTAKTGSNVTLQLCGVKLEKGDKMTPWIPNNSESMYTTLGLNGTIEYDCSGYCNNGTRMGTFSWTSDMPKYQVSTNILDGSYIDTGYKENIGTGDFTVSVWIKMPQTSGKSYQPIFSNKTTGAASVGFAIYFNQNQNKLLWSTADGSAATEIWMADTINIYDKWMHIVMVRNTSDAKKGYFYINGERYELASVPVIRNITNETYNIQIGDIATHNNSAYRYVGLISDFRIYATALSADDVKSLYQNSAYIDSSGNVYGAVH